MLALLLLTLYTGCSLPPPRPDAKAAPDPPTPVPAKSDADAASPPRADLDGDDDPIDTGAGPLPAHGRFVRIGRPPLALQRICDLTPFGGALYAAHANQPLGTDGATISRYDPHHAPRSFTVAFDWNRPNEPTRGGGAGQGFLRVHAIGGRLFVPDADPPYAGFGLADHGTEGYVFLSSPDGRFASARAPHARPPAAPGADGGGAAIVPRAYHVLDVIRFRDRLYASTGSVPPTEPAWKGPAPGALHVASADLSRWTYEVDYPSPWRPGTWRLTFLTRFKDRLYAGIQDYDGRAQNDYVAFSPPIGATSITHDDVHPGRVVGGALTLRWFVDAPPGGPERLFWIAWSKSDGARLRVSEDGEDWDDVPLPSNAGSPTDIARFRGALVVLTERALFGLDADLRATELARDATPAPPFALGDAFCAAPLGVLDGVLYAGGQRDGALYRVEWEGE
jgi:hypothetical protein